MQFRTPVSALPPVAEGSWSKGARCRNVITWSVRGYPAVTSFEFHGGSNQFAAMRCNPSIGQFPAARTAHSRAAGRIRRHSSAMQRQLNYSLAKADNKKRFQVALCVLYPQSIGLALWSATNAFTIHNRGRPSYR